jgi:polysaccharide export outer membrane protein
MRRFLIALTAVVMSFGLLSPERAARAQEYLVQIGDRLEISVLEDPGLGRTVLVRPDGRITMPLAGTLEAAGSTPEALQARIRNALSSQFVQPPTVTVSVTSVGPGAIDAIEAGTAATVYVIGQVGRPGNYQVELPMDVLQLLAIAGGPQTFAARDRIQVRRRGSDGESVLLFDYDSIERGAVPSTEIMVADGDVIVVPERRLFE